MILSHKHKFVFIKGEKVAGTSAEIALSQVCGPEDIITPMIRRDELHRMGKGEPQNYTTGFYPAAIRQALERGLVEAMRRGTTRNPIIRRLHRQPFFNHMSLTAVLDRVPQADGYQILGVERSPYAKVMSFANWQKHYGAYRKGGALPKDRIGMADAVDAVLGDGSVRRVLNLDLYRDLEGRVRVQPWRTDTLERDMRTFFESRDLEQIPLVQAKRGTDSDAIDPEEAMRPDQIAAINEIFAEEFELFGWPKIRQLRSPGT